VSLVMAAACSPDAAGVINLALNPRFDDAQLEVSRTAIPRAIVRNPDRTTSFLKIP
jgi:hypothetical protein